MMNFLKKTALFILPLALLTSCGKKSEEDVLKDYRKAMKDIKQISTAMASYCTDHGKYPDIKDSEALSKAESFKIHMKTVPVKDPWGKPYIIGNENGIIMIASAGSDGKFDGFNQQRGVISDMSSGQDIVLKDHEFITIPVKSVSELTKKVAQKLEKVSLQSQYLQAMKDVKTIGTAMGAYLTFHAEFPSWQDINEMVTDNKMIEVMKKIPTKDPWGNDYLIKVSGEMFYIATSGPDGKFDGFDQQGAFSSYKEGKDIVSKEGVFTFIPSAASN